MKRTSKTALALAAAAAALFATGCSTMCGSNCNEALVKCAGSNACKGSSECATPDNSCKARNSCKAAGWSYMTKGECTTAGGTVVD
ncbi:MAG: hypothetical protein AB7I18_06175 [Candidatus Berkiella sp.]